MIKNAQFKKITILIAGLILVSLLLKLFFVYDNKDWSSLSSIDLKSRKKLAYSFIENNLTSHNGGIYANFLTNRVFEYGIKGDYVLSESIGLMMNFALIERDFELFECQYQFLVNYMMTESNFIPWYVQTDGSYSTNSTSTLDDIRIAKQLIKAYVLFGEEKYMKRTVVIAENIIKYETNDFKLLNYYDWQEGKKSDRIKLAYLDIDALELFSRIDNRFKQIKNNGQELLNKSCSEFFPFFRQTYNYSDQEFEQNDEMNIINLLLTALNRSESGSKQTAVIAWIIKELQQNKVLYGKYNYHSAAPAVNFESIAAYAIGVRLALLEGEPELAETLLKKLLSFQDMNNKSPTYGGFVFAAGGESYSFDNLQAMIALALYLKGREGDD